MTIHLQQYDGTWRPTLRHAVISHCQAIKAVCDLLAEGKTTRAIARLDQAVSALDAVSRGQALGIMHPCPHCEAEQDYVAWCDDRRCRDCLGELNVHELLRDDDEVSG